MESPKGPKVYIATVEVKGYQPEEVSFSANVNGKIMVSGEHAKTECEFGWYTSKFHRSYDVPQEVDLHTLTSRIADGVMYIEGFMKLPPQNDDQKFHMTIDVRGFNPDDVKVSVLHYDITIQARQETESHGHYMARELYHNFTLPKDVDMNSLQTTLGKDGRLHIEGMRLGFPPATERRHLEIRKSNDGN